MFDSGDGFSLLVRALVDDFVIVRIIDSAKSRCDKHLVRNGSFDRKWQDLLFTMNRELEKPYLAHFTIRVELRVRIVTKIFQQPKIPPAFRSDGHVSPARNQHKSVYREIECLLLYQSIIYSRKRLLAEFSRRRVGQDVALQPVMVGVLTSAVEILHGSHDHGPQNYFILQRKADTASVRYFERFKDLLI